MLPSYQPYATFREVIRRWGSAADIEITTAFELTKGEWAELAPQVEAIEDISVVATGNGRFFLADAVPASTCDLTTGVCG
jgi:hypothetical protein